MTETLTTPSSARNRAAEAETLVASARDYVRGLTYEPMTDAEVAESRDTLERADHQNDMEFLPRPEWSQAFDTMLLEERLPPVLWRDVSNRLLREYAAMCR